MEEAHFKVFHHIVSKLVKSRLLSTDSTWYGLKMESQYDILFCAGLRKTVQRDSITGSAVTLYGGQLR